MQEKNGIRAALSVCGGVHIMLIDWKRGEFIFDLAVSFRDSDVSIVCQWNLAECFLIVSKGISIWFRVGIL
jgi:hypothetical protein